MVRDQWKCRLCKARNGLTAHHIVFRSRGGEDTSENLITLCSMVCHDAIHRYDLEILPFVEGEPINANRGVSWRFNNNWTPNRRPY
jgi:5-methylcytosine-specific restriction endonuclease McrA